MAEFTKATRLPLEQAIELVESTLESNGKVLLTELRQICTEKAPEAASLLEHTIQVMVHGGYLRRVFDGPGRLGYQKTERWVNRDETLIFLRAPRYKYRFRPRRNGVRIYPDTHTVSAGAALVKNIAPQSQMDLFGSKP